MIRSGRVVEKENGCVSVCFDRPEMCEHCGACNGKAHKELVKILGDAEIGDVVEVEMPDAKIVRASALAYVVPLVGLMAGLLIGQNVFGSDTAAAVGGLIGLGVCWLIMHFLDRKMGSKVAWQPKLIAVHKEEKHDGN